MSTYIEQCGNKTIETHTHKVYPTALEARVAARNARNRFICECMPLILTVLGAYIGKKVRTQTGLSAKLEKALCDVFPNTRGLFFRTSHISITAHFRAEAQYDNGRGFGPCTTYSDETVYIGEYGNDGVLEKVGTHNPVAYRTNFSADEITLARNAMPAAREVLYAAERRLCGFGEHDNNA